MPPTGTPTPPTTPTLDLSQQYHYGGRDYGPGKAVAIADPVAFTQIRRAVLAEERSAEATAQRAQRKAAAAADKAQEQQDAADLAAAKAALAAATDKVAADNAATDKSDNLTAPLPPTLVQGEAATDTIVKE